MGDGMKIAKLGCASGMVLAASTGQALAAETPASAVFDPTTIVAKGRISTYRHGTYPSEGDLTHAGIDIAAPCASSTVLAWQGGTVADVVSSVDDPNFDSLGYMVLIDHGTIKQAGKRTYSLYLHLNEPPRDANGNPLLKDGKVERGKKIGVVGATGAAQGCHLHFELRHFAGRAVGRVQRCPDRTGCHRIDANAARHQVAGQGHRERMDRALGGGIVE